MFNLRSIFDYGRSKREMRMQQMRSGNDRLGELNAKLTVMLPSTPLAQDQIIQTLTS